MDDERFNRKNSDIIIIKRRRVRITMESKKTKKKYEEIELGGLPQESFVLELPSGFSVRLSSNEHDIETLIALAFASHKQHLKLNKEKDIPNYTT